MVLVLLSVGVHVCVCEMHKLATANYSVLKNEHRWALREEKQRKMEKKQEEVGIELQTVAEINCLGRGTRTLNERSLA